MDHGSWYLLAYDVACPRRLQRVHRLLKSRGLAAQYSVFFVFGTERAIESLLDELDGIIRRREDDVRAWPAASPGEVWTHGRGRPPALVLPETHPDATTPGRGGWLGRWRARRRGR